MRAITIAVALSTLAACGGEEQASAVLAEAAPPSGVVASGPGDPGEAPAHPTTEDGLISALSEAIEAREITRLRRLVGPELGADLERMRDHDAEAFWGRAQRWVERVASGFEVSYRGEPDAGGRWRALITFGDGAEERVIFNRVEGELVFSEL